MDLANHTRTQSFLLAGFTTTGALRPLAFLGTLCIYLLTLAGNLCIIVLVQADSRLCTPMYFFISVLLACVDTGWHAHVHTVVIGIINACNLVLILGLYGGILRAVMKLPSAASRAKAFSTCSSHITVVVLFFASAFIVYVGPPESRPEGTDKLLALVYTFLTPFLNPIIYTFRNKEVREAVRRVTQSIRAMMKRP
ncbi:hypothetical protein FD755_000579 [Muntiacus reevesi]|uniref:G-protein coupled receptors family 1 profile domain-containing protein n=1 Tax=Muntiacus reevesi TaxID=9886 RepID=A0A5J5N127_MUNRE|nr:hypothetical protein FD755_000579 [Muntiacus reevesi]